MSARRIAARYAKSLLDFGNEQGQLETIAQDMKWFLEAVKNRDLLNLLKSPIVSQGKKRDIFEAIFGKSLSKTTNTFFNIILNKGREAIIPEIASEFDVQYKALNHVSSVKLTTASPLSSEVVKEIESKLLASNATDEKVELETAVNPDLIGGYVIEIGDKLYDDSIAHKLNKLKKEFSDNKYVKSY